MTWINAWYAYSSFLFYFFVIIPQLVQVFITICIHILLSYMHIPELGGIFWCILMMNASNCFRKCHLFRSSESISCKSPCVSSIKHHRIGTYLHDSNFIHYKILVVVKSCKFLLKIINHELSLWTLVKQRI